VEVDIFQRQAQVARPKPKGAKTVTKDEQDELRFRAHIQAAFGVPEHLRAKPMNHPHVLILDMRYADPRPAKEQFAERYEYGGWRNQEGFTAIGGTPTLQYPGDPPLKPIALMQLRDELIFVYLHGYVSIFQKDGSFEACRMD
jgi:hypothetical protein